MNATSNIYIPKKEIYAHVIATLRGPKKACRIGSLNAKQPFEDATHEGHVMRVNNDILSTESHLQIACNVLLWSVRKHGRDHRDLVTCIITSLMVNSKFLLHVRTCLLLLSLGHVVSLTCRLATQCFFGLRGCCTCGSGQQFYTKPLEPISIHLDGIMISLLFCMLLSDKPSTMELYVNQPLLRLRNVHTLG